MANKSAFFILDLNKVSTKSACVSQSFVRLTEEFHCLVFQVVLGRNSTQIRDDERIGNLVESKHLGRRQLSSSLDDEVASLFPELRVFLGLVVWHT